MGLFAKRGKPKEAGGLFDLFPAQRAPVYEALYRECREDPARFLEAHPEFQQVFAFVCPDSHAGLFQYFLEREGTVGTLDWKASASMTVYVLSRHGLPEEVYSKIDLPKWEELDTGAILGRIALALLSTPWRLIQVSPEFDDDRVVGVLPLEEAEELSRRAAAEGLQVAVWDKAYIRMCVDLQTESESVDRDGVDRVYRNQTPEKNGVDFVICDARYAETGKISLQETPFGPRLSPGWMRVVLAPFPDVLQAYEEGVAKVWLSVVNQRMTSPMRLEDPYQRFGQWDGVFSLDGK